ncbi:MAG TPA: hypothetical protein VFK33_10895 [Bacillales bacterium]|nr:hypothetical protein [Bacillales bacterium]
MARVVCKYTRTFVSRDRGVMVSEDYSIGVGETVTFENLFASFDEDEGTAREFALRRAYGVLFILEEAEGIPVSEHATTCDGELEWLVADDEFTVTEVEKENDLFIVHIEAAK